MFTGTTTHPRLPTTGAWTNHMISANVSDEDLHHTTTDLTFFGIRYSRADIVNSLQGLRVDHLGALAVLAKYLWSYMTPWLRKDVHLVTHAEKVFQGSLFLGLHVRRGDKLGAEANAIAVEEYLKTAANYFEDEYMLTGVDVIKAIWVASDDPDIVDEVRTLAPAYFPNVPSEAIVYVAFGMAGEIPVPHPALLPSLTSVRFAFSLLSYGYGSLVYILADFDQLAAAELFVGTFTSNVGRFVVLLREGLGKPRHSSISMDASSWYPG
ncbi:unnamed protein product [Laminaria digitata]